MPLLLVTVAAVGVQTNTMYLANDCMLRQYSTVHNRDHTKISDFKSAWLQKQRNTTPAVTDLSSLYCNIISDYTVSSLFTNIVWIYFTLLQLFPLLMPVYNAQS